MVSMECITAPEIETGSGLRPVRRALLSVTDKTGLLEFARALEAHSVELVSTGGTARSLREAGLEVRDISDLTGFPEMLDGRVKTLHPKVHGGILHRRGNPEHLASIEAHAIEPIDMVVVNLYPFEKTAAKPGVGFAEIIENIDIGGPSMVRSAAKNFDRDLGRRLWSDRRGTGRACGLPRTRYAMAAGKGCVRRHRGLRRGHRNHAGEPRLAF
jgi:hypothetical protein